MPFLITLLLSTTLLAQSPSVERAEAERLAQSGAYREALERFRALAASDPRDDSLRMWIGRLHMSLGHPGEAVPVFRAILATDPNRLDVVQELGRALTALGEHDAAIAVLNRAETRAPDNPQVLAALGRAHDLAGRPTLALAYYRRADLIKPDDIDIRRGLEQAQLRHGHRVSLSYLHETFPAPLPETNTGDLSVDFRLSDQWRVHGRGQAQDKFDRRDGRGGAGLEWRSRRGVSVSADLLFGPDAEVLPQWDGRASVTYTNGRVDWLVGAQYVQFEVAEVWDVRPGINVRVADHVSLRAIYHRSFTDRFGSGDWTGHDSGSIEAAIKPHRRLRLDVGYARGVEDFDTLSLDRTGRFVADTLIGGGQLDFPSLTSLVGRYEYQWRENDVQMIRLTVSIVQRF